MTFRRILALCIDWAMSMAISYGFFHGNSWATLGIFFVMRFLLTATIGTTFGKRLCSIRITRLNGDVPGFIAAFIRTLSLCLVLPAGVIAPDGRGMHDVWAGTRQEVLGSAKN